MQPAKAHWVNRDTIGLLGVEPNETFRLVPGYYFRLDQNGDVYTHTFGPGTASEHRMFSKLMLDTLKMWAEEYQVDGFRFDLMNFSFKENMLEIKKALHEIDPTIYALADLELAEGNFGICV